MEALDLVKIKNKLDAKKLEKAKLEGNLEKLLEQLKSEFSVESVKEAEKLLKKVNSELEKEEQELEEKEQEFAEKYPDLV